MPYQTKATSATPALVIYLLDCSGSMQDPLDGVPKIDHVNNALAGVLERMTQRSTKGEVISARYRLAFIAYNDQPIDLLGGIKTIDEVMAKGRPRLTPGGRTDSAAAFAYARDLLRKELPGIAGHPAPMICHLTDGQFTGSDPLPVAQEIMQMANADGSILVENIYVERNLTLQPILDTEKWPGVSDESEISDVYARKLFAISSPLPDGYAATIADDGYALRAGSRMLIPGTSKDLIELAFAMSGATPVV